VPACRPRQGGRSFISRGRSRDCRPGQSVETPLEQVEQRLELGYLRHRACGVDLRPRHADCDQQHAQVVAQSMRNGRIGFEPQLDAHDGGEQRFGVGLAGPAAALAARSACVIRDWPFMKEAA